jgi:Ca2+-binding RTX toxin-like protein
VQEIRSECVPDRFLRSIVALVAGVAAFAAVSVSGAQASQIRFDPSNTRIYYISWTGETNNVVLSRVGGNYVVTDTGSGMTDLDGAGGCEVDITQHVATCPQNVGLISVSALDQDDRITVAFAAADYPARGTILGGGPGRDIITGGPGPDQIRGLEGDDVIDPGGGIDPEVDAGQGLDTVDYSSRGSDHRVEVELRFGNTREPVPTNRQHAKEFDATGATVGVVRKLSGFENILGGAGNDLLVGGAEDNVLIGGAGADVLCGALGNDTVDYQGATGPVAVSLSGNPELLTDPRNVTTEPAARQDCRNIDALGNSINDPSKPDYKLDCKPDDGLVDPSTGASIEHDCVGDDVENVIGSPYGDVLVGNDPDEFYGGGPKIEPSGINHLEGRGGDDFLDGGLGPDVMDGGPGDDTAGYGPRTENVRASIDGAANDGSDLDRNLAYPDSGQTDSIGTDVENVRGGAGDDVLRGDANANFLDGGGGNDLISGAEGRDALEGGPGNDSLEGGDDGDSLDGGAGDDSLDGGFGGDSLAGGEGVDLADYSTKVDPISATANGAADDGTSNEGDYMGSDIESITGGPANDVLVANDGNGVLSGGDGDDTLDGAGGADTIVGGSGLDTVNYSSRSAALSVDLATPGGDGQAGENDNVTDSVEKVFGGSGDDTLAGDGNANLLSGGAGNDTLSGRGGDDFELGGAGIDTISGNEGNDTLSGNEGNDKLFGNAGGDGLSGGPGDDTFNGGADNDIFDGGSGDDTALYTDRTKSVDVTLNGADDDGEGKERDQIRTTVESVKTGSGDDTINTRDGVKGEISCGKGTDVVLSDTIDKVGDDCEGVGTSGLCRASPRSVAMTKRGVVGIRVSCPVTAKGTLTLESAGALKSKKAHKVRLGRKSFSIAGGKSKTVKIKLSKKGRRAVLRRKSLKARAVVRVRGKAKATSSKTTRTLTIKAPRKKR